MAWLERLDMGMVAGERELAALRVGFYSRLKLKFRRSTEATNVPARPPVAAEVGYSAANLGGGMAAQMGNVG